MVENTTPTRPAEDAPGPQTRWHGGQMVPMIRDPLRCLSRLAREYGDFVRFPVGPHEIFLVSDPEAIRDVFITHHRRFFKGRALQESKRMLGEGLLTSEGEFHHRQRRLVQPAFQPRRILTYAAPMAEYSARRRDEWRAGQTIDMADEMRRLTLAIVGKTLFDANVEDEAPEIGAALTDSLELFRWLSFPFFDLLARYYLPGIRKFERAKARLDSVLYRIIQSRRADPGDRGDLLSLLLISQDEEGGMGDEQVRDEAMTLFLAGHETMATAMTWTWYLLSQNPDAEARMYAEVDDVLGGRLPGADDVERLRYTEQVFAEAMRVYPPAWAVGRQTVDDVEIGGYRIPAARLVLMSPYVVHHDPRHYLDPERFDPDRWTPEERASRPRFSYFPFGGGPRNCIGEAFAWMEGVLILATVAQRWRFRHARGHRVATQPLITLRAKHGMRMIVEAL